MEIYKTEQTVRLGIDIGGTTAKIGIVDQENRVMATTFVPTGTEDAKVVIRKIADSTLELLAREQLRPEQCRSVGIGVPGMVNRREGVVIYSNNLKWKQVHLVEEMETYLSLPVAIANDADCAALGEAVAGAGKGVDSMVLLTLGTGVGGGIVWNGKLFEGSLLGGVELGHMTIKEYGETCTCGRKGCLEAYASATAMRRISKNVYGMQLEPLEIFKRAEQGEEQAKQIVNGYIYALGTGIVNIVNLLRPQRIVLGGGIASQGDVLLHPIREQMERECFGGTYSELPELVIASMGNYAGMVGAANLIES